MNKIDVPDRRFVADRRYVSLGVAGYYDRSARTLIVDGAPRPMEPRVADVLDMLLAADGEAVSRDSLLDDGWGADASDEALTQAVSKLRRALGDTRRPYRIIETLPKGGYRLVVETSPHSVTPAAPQQPAAPAMGGRKMFFFGVAVGVLFCLALYAVLLIANPPRRIEQEVVCPAGVDITECQASNRDSTG